MKTKVIQQTTRQTGETHCIGKWPHRQRLVRLDNCKPAPAATMSTQDVRLLGKHCVEDPAVPLNGPRPDNWATLAEMTWLT
jgi:hypothetical protein